MSERCPLRLKCALRGLLPAPPPPSGSGCSCGCHRPRTRPRGDPAALSVRRPCTPAPCGSFPFPVASRPSPPGAPSSVSSRSPAPPDIRSLLATWLLALWPPAPVHPSGKPQDAVRLPGLGILRPQPSSSCGRALPLPRPIFRGTASRPPTGTGDRPYDVTPCALLSQAYPSGCACWGVFTPPMSHWKLTSSGAEGKCMPSRGMSK